MRQVKQQPPPHDWKGGPPLLWCWTLWQRRREPHAVYELLVTHSRGLILDVAKALRGLDGSRYEYLVVEPGTPELAQLVEDSPLGVGR